MFLMPAKRPTVTALMSGYVRAVNMDGLVYRVVFGGIDKLDIAAFIGHIYS